MLESAGARHNAKSARACALRRHIGPSFLIIPRCKTNGKCHKQHGDRNQRNHRGTDSDPGIGYGNNGKCASSTGNRSVVCTYSEWRQALKLWQDSLSLVLNNRDRSRSFRRPSEWQGAQTKHVKSTDCGKEQQYPLKGGSNACAAFFLYAGPVAEVGQQVTQSEGSSARAKGAVLYLTSTSMLRGRAGVGTVPSLIEVS